MTTSSLSFNFVNVYSTSARPATAGRAPAAVSRATEATPEADGRRSAGRPNRLTQALAAALREIGIGATGGTSGKRGTTATTDTTATPAATLSIEGDVDAAVQLIAHALLDALGAGREARGHSGEHRQDGEHGHHGHRHGHGLRNAGYVDMAQRLDSLSQTIVKAPPAAPAPSAPATAVAPVAETPVSLAPTVESDISAAATAPAVPAPAGTSASRLIDAFSKLFDALQPQAAADAPASGMASRLQQFLHTLAQALSRGGSHAAAAPQTGAFVDVSA